MRKPLVLLIVLVLVVGQASALRAQEASPSPAASPPSMDQFLDQIRTGQVCAWPVVIATTPDALNVAYPETHSAYFIMPYILSPGQSFVLNGTYPFDRFTSLVTYYRILVGGRGLELLGWLPDYAIVPDAGSANPAADPNASTDPAQRQWTVRITGTASVSATPVVATPVAGQNVLPAMPTDAEGVIGVMALRIYVPDDATDLTGGVGLPTVTLEEASGATRELTPCTATDRETWKQFFTPFVIQIIKDADPLPLPPGPDVPPQWVQNRFPGLGTNPDNRYLMAPLAWTPGRVVVVRGKAPTFPDTQAGQSPATPAQLRFWSFCTGSNVIPLPAASCVDDFEIPVAADGTYTIAVSQPEDKPANATADNGVAWLQGADPSQPDLLFLRHMLPSEAFFGQSVWAVPEGVPGAAGTIMGPYYPAIAYCDTATFEAGGADACFAAAGMATPGA
jgi:hypothetical protein